ncbi:hypothetical protein GCM10007304_30310 [Rhodococcoides trifolii]|uniref:HNH nuclease domain-containing protein n=1 Tax=Rhodococcoides trifolii TaxID=908250 RepID=A0A917FYG5_9NOCA|nr:HNH endonuclease signature motif containing protein [Rhodococcus trifolii]GGG14155.1 hypothetical protein GCM10007304_30310 [Rhodococcus trifolii]
MSDIKSKRWQKLRTEILQRDSYECGVAGCEVVATTVDHIIPRSKGGAMWDTDNLIAMCAHHNYSKGPKLETEVRREWFSFWFDDIDLTDLAG